jgi:uncharacterized small protein (TIGR04563 family)
MSVYLPDDMDAEIREEARRLDRTISWIVQQAWKLAKYELRKFPTMNESEEKKEPLREVG